MGIAPTSLLLLVGSTDDSRVTLTALDCKGAQLSDVTWSWQSDAENHTDVREDSITGNPATATVEGRRVVDSRIVFTATATYRGENGSVQEYTGDAILSVTVVPKDTLGLSNYQDFNEIELGTATEYAGEDNKTYTGSDAPSPQGRAELFLYGSTNAALGEWSIQSITMTGSPVALVEADEDGVYHDEAGNCTLHLGQVTEIDARGFQYRLIRFWGKNAEETVTLTFTLVLGEDRTATLEVQAVPQPCVVTFRDELGNNLLYAQVPYGSDASVYPYLKTGISVSETALAALSLTEGYEFVEWDKDIQHITSDLIVNAVVELCTYEVALLPEGGTVTPESLSIPYGGNYGALPTPDYPGYTFAGWFYTVSEGVTEQVLDNEALRIADDHDLVAHWTPNAYTVRFDRNATDATGNDMADMPFVYDISQPLTANSFARVGYTFSGWNTAADGTGTPYDGGASAVNLTTAPNGIVTLYAQWEPLPCEVTYSSNFDGGAEETVTESYGAPYHLPDFTREGYRLSGWKDEDGNAVTAQTLVSTLEPHTLYAQWIGQYTITFAANGGEGTMDPMVIDCGTGSPLTANGFSRSGHRFAGWIASDEAASSYDDGDIFEAPDYDPNGDNGITLTAQWVGVYTVVFHANDGTDMTTPQTIDCVSGTLTLSSNAFSRTGYRITGWKTENGTDYANGTVFTAPNEPGGSIAFYAQWIGVYTVNFDANGGTGTMADLVIECGTTSPLPSNGFSQTGCEFRTWSTARSIAEDGGNTQTYANNVDFTAPDEPGSITLYARWNREMTFYQEVTSFNNGNYIIVYDDRIAFTGDADGVSVTGKDLLEVDEYSGKAMDKGGNQINEPFVITYEGTLTPWTRSGNKLSIDGKYLGYNRRLYMGTPGSNCSINRSRLLIDNNRYLRYQNDEWGTSTRSGTTLTFYQVVEGYAEE